MNIWIKTTICVFIFLSLFSFKIRKFPRFEKTTIRNEKISDAIFEGKMSIVVIGHLGCPPMMKFINDCQNSNIDDKYQLIFFFENTNEQVTSFNSLDTNIWSSSRLYFKLDPITEISIPECENDKLKYLDGNLIVKSQCRGISKKLRTRSSPSIYVVDSLGNIEKATKGYIVGLNADQRLKTVLNEK